MLAQLEVPVLIYGVRNHSVEEQRSGLSLTSASGATREDKAGNTSSMSARGGRWRSTGVGGISGKGGAE